MKLALIGRGIQHSLSPKLYRDILGDQLEVYDLLDIPHEEDLPALSELAQRYDGLNITAPYKQSYFPQLLVKETWSKELAAVNVIDLKSAPYCGGNTDAQAFELILLRWKAAYPGLRLIILGDGVLGRMARLMAERHGLEFHILSRRRSNLHSAQMTAPHPAPTLVINTCSRDFVFSGPIHPDFSFWDLNYDFLPHASLLPDLVKFYQDGREMLELQARAAIAFWSSK
jgi:shikimate 5-dehydrogenase